MREMKESGVEWIGEVPKEWDVVKLKNVLFSLISGSTPDSGNNDYYCNFEDGIPWISIADMSGEELIFSTKKSVTPEAIKSKNLTVLPIGTLIYSIYASLGNVSELKIDATTNQAILGFVLNEFKVNKQFLKSWMKAIKPYLDLYMNSNTQNNLNANSVRNLPLCLPSYITQQKIALYLDSKNIHIDSIIEKTKQSIEEYKKYKLSLITEAVTKGLDKKVKMKDSGVEWIGEIPEHWDVVSIGKVFNFIGGFAFNSDDFSNENTKNQVLRIGNIKNEM